MEKYYVLIVVKGGDVLWFGVDVCFVWCVCCVFSLVLFGVGFFVLG